MSKTEDSKKPYVWVKDSAGREYLCSAGDLKEIEKATEEELAACIDVDALREHIELD